VRIITNPGSNLTARAIGHYGIEIGPQRIIVDGAEHDTRGGIPFAEVDDWVKTAKEFPHVVGTTANELGQIFTKVGRTDPEMICVTSSKKIIQSHAAGLAAARVLSDHPTHKNLRIAVVDSTTTDVGAGLIAIAAGEAAKANVPLKTAVESLEAMSNRARLAFTVATLENLKKSGRASFLRAFVANFFDIKPLIGIVDGELQSIGKVSGKADATQAIVDDVKTTARGPVWVGVSHGEAPEKAEKLIARLRNELDVAYAYVRPLSSSIYLYAGRGSIMGLVIPIDGLPWTPPTPPDFSHD
jgi:DegV family protein with EDD domain